jgi:hypothetical protein
MSGSESWTRNFVGAARQEFLKLTRGVETLRQIMLTLR